MSTDHSCPSAQLQDHWMQQRCPCPRLQSPPSLSVQVGLAWIGGWLHQQLERYCASHTQRARQDWLMLTILTATTSSRPNPQSYGLGRQQADWKCECTSEWAQEWLGTGMVATMICCSSGLVCAHTRTDLPTNSRVTTWKPLAHEQCTSVVWVDFRWPWPCPWLVWTNVSWIP